MSRLFYAIYTFPKEKIRFSIFNLNPNFLVDNVIPLQQAFVPILERFSFMLANIYS